MAQEPKPTDPVIRSGEDPENGDTLNQLLETILGKGKPVDGAGTLIGPDAIRDIPFLLIDHGATLCVEQLTARDAWPVVLLSEAVADERRAFHGAAEGLIAEIATSDSTASLPKATKALAQLKEKFKTTWLKDTPEWYQALDFLDRLDKLLGRFSEKALQVVIKHVYTYIGGDIGDVISLMASLRLRFGDADPDSERQRSTYRTLYLMLRQAGG